MSHGLQWELTLLQDRWQATYREDASIKQLLRQCAAARRLKEHAQMSVRGCQSHIKQLSGYLSA